MTRRNALPLPIDERPAEHGLKLLAGVAALAMMGLGVVGSSPIMLGSGAIAFGALTLSRLVVDLRRGETSSNWGHWRRNEHRIYFNWNVCFWGAIAAAWFVLGGLAMSGRIPLAGP
jgi:hypothetical protein